MSRSGLGSILNFCFFFVFSPSLVIFYVLNTGCMPLMGISTAIWPTTLVGLCGSGGMLSHQCDWVNYFARALLCWNPMGYLPLNEAGVLQWCVRQKMTRMGIEPRPSGHTSSSSNQLSYQSYGVQVVGQRCGTADSSTIARPVDPTYDYYCPSRTTTLGSMRSWSYHA